MPCRSTRYIWVDILSRSCYIELRDIKAFLSSQESVQSTVEGDLEQAEFVRFFLFSPHLFICFFLFVYDCSVCMYVSHVCGHTYMWVHIHMVIFVYMNAGG